MASKSRDEYLAKNTAIFAFGNICDKAIHFFLVPLCTSALSTEEYGTVDLMISVLAIINAFTMISIDTAVRRFLLDKDANVGKIKAVLYFWNFAGIIISTAIYFIMKAIPVFSQYALLMSFYTFSVCLFNSWSEYLKGRGYLLRDSICCVSITFIIAMLSIVTLKYMKMGIKGYFLPYIICYFIGATFAFILGKQYKHLNKISFDKNLFKKMTSFSFAIIPNSIMWWVMNSFDKIMVTSMISASANGIYSVSYKLPSLMSVFNSVIMKAWQFSAVKESESSDREEYNNKMFKFYFSSLALIFSGLLFILKPFTRLYVPAEYYTAWKYSPFLIMGLMYYTLGEFIGTIYYVEKDMKSNLFSSVIGAVVNVGLNFCLIPTVGINGAAIATCVSYIVLFVYRVINTKKYLVIHTVTPYTVILTVIEILMLVFVYIESFWSYILMAICCIAVLFITKDTFLPIIKRSIKIKKQEG